MRKSMFFTAVIAVLVGCSSDTTTAPPIDNTPHAGYFVAVNGSQAGDGSAANPWDLATALAQPSMVQPGDTIWLHGGTYTGVFTSALAGAANAPIVVRQFPGERATIDGRLNINGQYAYYWGFEVMYSDPKRVTALAGSDPTDMPRQNMTVFVGGSFNKLINMNVHDLGDGLFSGSPAEGLEIYGSIFYNNGWQGPDKGYGHNLYLQNQNATKYVTDNVLFNSFSSGFQIYGSDAAYLWNFDVEGNTIFGAGDPVASQFGTRYNLEQRGASGRFGRSTFRDNSIYHRNGTGFALAFNAAGEPPGENITFSNNIVHGEAVFYEVNGYTITGNKFTSGSDPLSGQSVLIGFRRIVGASYSINTWKNNQYAVPPSSSQDPFYVYDSTGVLYKFPGWTSVTGYDQGSSFVSGQFASQDVVVRPNKYEAGRAIVTCWNWTGAGFMGVDLSGVLKAGEKYEVHHVFDLYGTPVASGTYQGGQVQFPQPTLTPPTPVGYTPSPTMPDNRFNVFLVTKAK